MPIDWDKFDSDLDSAIERAADKTDDELASKMSSLTKMNDEEIKELFSDPGDVKKLYELIKIVKSAQNRNDKINQIVDNAEKFGGVVLTLLDKLA